RSDELQRGVVSLPGVEIPESPDFTAVVEAMAGRVVAAEHDQASPLPVLPKAGRGVGLTADGDGVRLALDLPNLLAGRLVQGDDRVADAVEQCQVKPVFVQQGSIVNAVQDVEFAVTVLGIELPDLAALEIVARDRARPVEGVDVLAVGAWRG